MRWSQARHLEVVDTSTAESVGHVYGPVIDPDRSRVTGIVVGKRVVAWDDLGGLGNDAMTVPSTEVLREPDTDDERAAVSGDSSPMAKPVYSEDGYDLGPLEDFELDPTTGEITSISIPGDVIAGDLLLGIGSFAVVVASADRDGDGRAAADAVDDDLEQLTKDELYERAQALDIEGRSTMSKDELIAALR